MTKKYYRDIIFTKSQLKTHLKFEDQFQIYPCDFAGAPTSYYCHDFPVVIEFWVDMDQKVEVGEFWEDLKDFAADGMRMRDRLTKLIRLLSALSNHRFFQNNDTEFKWGLPLPATKPETQEEKDKIDNQSSQGCLLKYMYLGMNKDLNIKGFSEPRHPEAKLAGHMTYFTHDPFDERTREVTFPMSINKALKKYFSLDEKSLKFINSVILLICNGIDLHEKMRSLSFISYVSGMETLANFEYKKPMEEITFECPDCQAVKSSHVSCQKCGRPIWGVKVKFKMLLRTYVAYSDEAQTKFNKMYNLRSQIVHTGALLLGDDNINWTDSTKENGQYQTHLETKQAAKIALVNWLMWGPGKQMVVEEPQKNDS